MIYYYVIFKCNLLIFAVYIMSQTINFRPCFVSKCFFYLYFDSFRVVSVYTRIGVHI